MNNYGFYVLGEALYEYLHRDKKEKKEQKTEIVVDPVIEEIETNKEEVYNEADVIFTCVTMGITAVVITLILVSRAG